MSNQRQMTWDEIADEMVKQRTRAEKAEAEVERLRALCLRRSGETWDEFGKRVVDGLRLRGEGKK